MITPKYAGEWRYTKTSEALSPWGSAYMVVSRLDGEEQRGGPRTDASSGNFGARMVLSVI